MLEKQLTDTYLKSNTSKEVRKHQKRKDHQPKYHAQIIRQKPQSDYHADRSKNKTYKTDSDNLQS